MANTQGLPSLSWLMTSPQLVTPLDKDQTGRRCRRRWNSESSGSGSPRRSSTPSYFSVSADDFTEEGEQLDASRPPFSFTCLIGLAILSAEDGQRSLTVGQIYEYISRNFPFFQSAKGTWRNSVRHVLSLNTFFQKPLVDQHTAAVLTTTNAAGERVSKIGGGWEIKPGMLEPLAEQIADGQRLLKVSTARHLGLPALRPRSAEEEAAAAARGPRRRRATSTKRQRASVSEADERKPPLAAPGTDPHDGDANAAGSSSSLSRNQSNPNPKSKRVGAGKSRSRGKSKSKAFTRTIKREGPAPIKEEAEGDDAGRGAGGGGGAIPARPRTAPELSPRGRAGGSRSGGGSRRRCNAASNLEEEKVEGEAEEAEEEYSDGPKPRRRRMTIDGGSCGGTSRRSLSMSSATSSMMGMAEMVGMEMEMPIPMGMGMGRRLNSVGNGANTTTTTHRNGIDRMVVKSEPDEHEHDGDDHYGVDMRSLATSMASIVDDDEHEHEHKHEHEHGGDIFGESINSVFSSSNNGADSVFTSSTSSSSGGGGGGGNSVFGASYDSVIAQRGDRDSIGDDLMLQMYGDGPSLGSHGHRYSYGHGHGHGIVSTAPAIQMQPQPQMQTYVAGSEGRVSSGVGAVAVADRWFSGHSERASMSVSCT